MGEVALLGFRLRLGLVRGGIGAVADVRPRVEPVVRADGDGHQAEGGESPHGGQQRLNPAVAPSHCALILVRTPLTGSSRSASGRGSPPHTCRGSTVRWGVARITTRGKKREGQWDELTSGALHLMLLRAALWC